MTDTVDNYKLNISCLFFAHRLTTMVWYLLINLSQHIPLKLFQLPMRNDSLHLTGQMLIPEMGDKFGTGRKEGMSCLREQKNTLNGLFLKPTSHQPGSSLLLGRM